MRNVFIGKFADYRPEISDYDCELIGAHSAITYELEKLTKTIGLEYYIKTKGGKNVMIKDATILEKALARIKYIFKINKVKVVGYRSDKVSDLSRADYSLGRKYDEGKGKWVVDKEYYESRGYIDGKKVDPQTGETRIAKGYFSDERE